MNYKRAIEKIEQGKKFILLIVALLPIVSISVQAMQIKLDDPIYIKGYKHKDTGCGSVIMGVQGASYVVSPAQDDQYHLSFHADDTLKLVNNIGRENLFSFLEVENLPLHYKLMHVDSEEIIRNSFKDKCFVDVMSDHKFHLLFREHEDGLPAFLQYNLKKEVYILGVSKPPKDDDQLLIIEPIYEFSSLEQTDVDGKTWLFKLPKKEKISGKTLSVDQIQALYALKYDGDHSKQLAVVREDDDFIYAYTTGLSYCTEGISIQSVDFPLRISHIKQFSKIIKDSDNKTEEINKDQDVVKLEKGKTLTLTPDYSDQSDIPSFGDITITPGERGYWSVNYGKRVECKMGKLIELRNTGRFRFFPDYVVVFTGDSIQLVDTSRIFLTASYGEIAFVTDSMGKEMLSAWGAEVFKSAELVSKGIIDHGKSIEEASKMASEALLEASKNLSAEMKSSMERLAEEITYASNTFKGATESMSSKMSGDIDRMLKSLKVLSNDLKEVSKTLSEGAKDAMVSAGQSFEKAFEELSKALENSSGNMSEAVKIASRSFIEGTNKIRDGLSNINVNANVRHKWSIWNFFGF